ncbi:ATP-binding protein [Asticcacaulis sp. YBE204]|uniref:sensor histidine kinase n=1 Tax=Asticcacaulis sp. YBE204 TaxID=1282363 RepID=UPI0003C3EA52|nr:ATP-binding protein [Asticcacaulis sp. YBE204]ESQ79060.1 hypothetical protein AEYBE204_11590 [Asticcacaulis sp. YBE204]
MRLPSLPRFPSKSLWPWLLAGLAIVAAFILYETHSLTYAGAMNGLTRDARVTAQLRVAVLQSELDKQRSAPVILADDSDVVSALQRPDPERFRRISQKLERLQHETRSAVIYIIDASGTTVAASNWALPTSFVGSAYGFRPYFREALTKGTSEQFALGTVSRRPGLYLAHSIVEEGKTLGVVVVKMEFDAIEATWADSAEPTFVTGPNDEILLTSHPEQRFHKVPTLTRDQFLTTLPAPAKGWQLHLVGSRRPAERLASGATLTAVLGLGLILTLLAWQWRRRRQIAERAVREAEYRERLEHDVAARTEALSVTNARLSDEIHERHQAEQRLNSLQADLVQANKLASLGQITAGVAHEINQPVATIRVLADNTLRMIERKSPAKAIGDNLGTIARMCERIGHITGELRTFSRKATGETEPISLKETIDSSILLNKSRLHENRVKLLRDRIDPALRVMAGRVRLEQVLVNLLQNAFEALEATPDPVVRITVAEDADWVVVCVADNGPGLPPQVREALFTPFVTTKPKGLGLGLVIAHDILRDFGGELSAESDDSGTTFTLKLRKVVP